MPAAAAHQGDLIHGLTKPEVEALTAKCLEARGKAYCPYSHFRVGAALLLDLPSASPTIVTGANVENAAYPVGTCAERVAVGTAVTTYGHRAGLIRAVAVATDLPDAFCSPCGMCRQFLREFLDLDTPIFMHTSDGRYEVMSMGELLPRSFGPDVLPGPGEMRAVRGEGNGKA